MRLLTDDERIVLREVGPPGEYAPDAVFEECVRLGWGLWGDDGCWYVTSRGRAALALDAAARACE